MPTYQDETKTFLLQYSKKLQKKETQTFLQLSKGWEVVTANLERLVSGLSLQENLSKDKLFKLGLYQEFLVVSRTQTNIYYAQASGLISDGQKFFGEAGVKFAQQALGLDTVFYQMNVGAVDKFIGMSQQGSPLYELLAKSYPETVTKLTDTLLEH